ncbi:hypothetical protein A0J61_01678 [Choanephora cucurbitarum]|uniref:Uncharacterized protein n=1 Tax=Choanephora cucurbitarum TaxID=101091 RepID=A0A1C7NMA0_9FUNG|nr:hypothetical protein A0J61_01678 [Choanephora cucurbitarum]
MRHKPAISKAVSLPAIDLETRVERSLSYRHDLSILEEDWQNSSQQLGITSSTSSFDVCHCCGQQFCENLDYYNRTIRKLESDTRLAAEIGQGLLHKHETFVTESNQQKAQLEKQVTEYHQKLIELEQSLDELENEKDQLLSDKNKWLWEYQKSQKILDETVSDLQMANEKCKQLSMELKSKSEELEKLRLFKFMVRNSESREEMLTSKLEDTNQELALCRRNELVLESKMKKLRMRYGIYSIAYFNKKQKTKIGSVETLHDTHEQLTKHLEQNISSHRTVDNEDAIKCISADQNNSTDDLIHLIKELSLSNAKLKSELLSCKDQLLEAQEEVVALGQMEGKQKIRRVAAFKEKKKTEPVPVRSETFLPAPIPSVSSSLPTSSVTGPPLSDTSPIVHHHYHYYLKNNQSQIPDDMKSSSSTQTNTSQESSLHQLDMIEVKCKTNSIRESPSQSDMSLGKRDEDTPFVVLREYVTQLLDKLRGSDTRALNRQLRRAFDIQELSRMSNAMIENILLEIEALDSRFLWWTDTTGDFFPLLELLKDMLKELGLLKSTINELQLAYVKKIEESEQRVQEEVIKKRQQQRKQYLQHHRKSDMLDTKPLSWFTNIFITRSPKTMRRSSGRHNSYDSNFHTGSTMTNTSTLMVIEDEPIAEEEESSGVHKHPEEDNPVPRIAGRNTFPRPIPEMPVKRKPKPVYMPHSVPSLGGGGPFASPQMHASSSTGTSNRAHLGVRNKRSYPRVHIDYEGIGPAAIRPIPSDRDLSGTTNFSSSWLGGK